MILGITGGIGSGKSLLTGILQKEHGFAVISTDLLAEELMLSDTALKNQLMEALGEEIYLQDGSLNRARYAALLCDSGKRILSDSIVHPAVWEETGIRIRKLLAEEPEKEIAVETALPGSALKDLCSRVLYVSAEPEIRIGRLMKNRGYSRERAEAMIALQPREEEYLSCSTDRICNNGGIDELRCQLERIL